MRLITHPPSFSRPCSQTINFNIEQKHRTPATSTTSGGDIKGGYVIIIILLKLSSEYSFPSDLFNRIKLENVPWYLERSLKNINLGSLLILVLLRLITCNLNRWNDVYLLENTVAVMLNLRKSIKNLHPYTCERLVKVLGDTLDKKITTLQGVSSGLIKIVNGGLEVENVESNLELVYCLIWRKIEGEGEVKIVREVLEGGELERLTDEGAEYEELKGYIVRRLQHLKSKIREIQKNVEDEEVFNYVEDVGSRDFFVPRVWEVLVGVTGERVEWEGRKIGLWKVKEEGGGEVESGGGDVESGGGNEEEKEEEEDSFV
ncbi:hypothetical protein TrLO_g2222 [Triparma laevis f. longispina]|uniref:Dymeclin n=1 Tax=Triparma laevis f. longispina TaxID=1714387 RepID=A0A9W7A2A7_9STRA|nr:hypothetical protein TrLO_g2222 [Triparma laevis f. longispina]